MLYQQDYHGFVYIWRDRKHGRFYIGSHMGATDDGYICSSTWMRNAYRRRPHDFKRRIIYWHREAIRETLLIEEQRWLHMVRDDELKTRYYNRARRCWGEDVEKLRVKRQGAKNSFFGKTHTPETRAKIAAAQRARPPETRSNKMTAEGRQRVSAAARASWEDPALRARMSQRPNVDRYREAALKRWADPEKREYWRARIAARRPCSS